MKVTKCLAYIWPAEDIQGKEEALANVKFLSGPYERKIGTYRLTTGIYRYYYWGVTLEVVSLDENGAIVEVADLQKEDLIAFNMNLIHALSFNSVTHEVLGSNGFVYKLDQSLFYRDCKNVCEYMYQQMETANNMVLQMYTRDGAVIDLLFEKDVTPERKSYKYVIQKGFVTPDDKILRSMVPKKNTNEQSDEVLKQADIDRLVERLTVASPCLELKE